MNFLFDPCRTEYRTPVSALQPGEVCALTVRSGGDVSSLTLILHTEDGAETQYPFTREGELFRVRFSLAQTGLFFYHLRAEVGGMTADLFANGREVSESGEEWEISCCPEPAFDWRSWAGRCMYQIFPDRFHKAGDCDLRDKLTPFTVHASWDEAPVSGPNADGVWNSDFFGGNLRGITEKLPYLRDLGIRILYINPIFMAQSNHRYDTADYRRIDPMLGTEADLAALFDAAHKAGMRVLLDGVFSHTGSNSVYFDADHVFGHGAASDPESPFRSWYEIDPDGKYECWWGVRTLPCVRETEPDYMEFMLGDQDSVVAHWLRAGADGFRLDVADELPPEFLSALHRRVKDIKTDALVLGEVWEDASDKISYGVRRRYFTAPELDCVMNYPFRSAVIDFISEVTSARELTDNLMRIVSHYPASALHTSMVMLSTHDTPRIITTFAAKEGQLTDGAYMEAVQKTRTAAFLQFMLPGMPCIYYGDEAGMQGGRDPDNRRPFDWEHIDTRLHDYYASLAALRQKCEALRTGDLIPVSDDGRLLIMQRGKGNDAVRFAVNMGEDPAYIGADRILMSENCGYDGNTVTVYKFGAVAYRSGEENV